VPFTDVLQQAMSDDDDDDIADYALQMAVDDPYSAIACNICTLALTESGFRFGWARRGDGTLWLVCEA
jgi:hypothetical protein